MLVYVERVALRRWNRQVGAEQGGTLLGTRGEEEVGVGDERGTVLWPPSFDLVVGAVHAVNAPDSLFGHPKHCGEVEVDHGGGALQI